VPRIRLDQLIVQRGLAPSRAAAQVMLLAGEVELEGQGRSLKPGNLVTQDVQLTVRPRPRWASRAGDKLAVALDTFGVEATGRTALDAGASAGGFTDVLLARGAARVYAVDVGRAQLVDRLRHDQRVISMEQTNLRTLESLPEPVQLATLDLSFISLRLVMPVVRRLLTSDGSVIALVKPQFEAGKGAVPRGGVIRDAAVHASVLRQFAADATESGFGVNVLIRSPMVGTEGNIEFLAHLAEPPGMAPEALEERIQVLTAPSA
jgi:23S rRNA (cytidine1920-2'-O)/16S rRNA (cytidine1409-2'-O)-methyltransferase